MDGKPVELFFYARPSKRVGVVMMEADKFQTAIIAELAALRYVVEQVGGIAFLAAAMRPEHAASMRQTAQERLARDRFPGLEAVWSDHLGAEIVDSASAILTNIEAALAESYLRARPPTSE
jgi:hypothetical protein